ncbi:hypothetical protein H7E67_01130 [Clostridium gasigenes]|uniref:gp53-like domain-containing protein n=1 Tax=Clostridium gasigenes TaxID=94869 RepID=UPI00162685E4|nr:hypothetical protein [Clostridium gasigenes]MBB6622022.1 hypothetical protein [Clostridium gasigenes]
MASKNAIYQVDNGTDFDEINFRTIAAQVICADGKTVEALLETWDDFKNNGGGIGGSIFPSKKLMGLGTITDPWNSLFLKSFLRNENGFTELPNGFLMQWGTTNNAPNSVDARATFPTLFPNRMLVTIPVGQQSQSVGHIWTAGATDNRTYLNFIKTNNVNMTDACKYIAIGY